MDNEKPSDENDQKPAIPGFSSINEFSQKTLKAVLQATKSSNDLPVGSDYDFYSTFSTVRDVLDMEGQRVLSLLQRVLRHQNVKGNVGPGASMDLEERFDILMDVNDQILERAGTLLDEASGVKKQEAKLVLASTPKPQVSTSWNKKTDTSSNAAKAATAYRLLTARNIQRPQLRFKDKIDNSNNPFKPSIKEKPNALKSLEDSLRLPDSVTLEDTTMPDFKYPHPYAYELEKFSPGSDLLTRVNPKEPLPPDSTPLIHVDTEDQLNNLLVDLKQQKEIAVDLEHHSYRSFQGLTCLMQISTRSHDYIVDTIDLRNELHILNEVFTDPKVTKVFHGADSDINWLQRDFGIYVINMFDTGQAARVLSLPRFSLAHALMHYCRVEADKQFQLADWRIRPLPEELIKYAREDTHYLLYIYDLMRNQLLDSGNNQANLLHSVYTRSKLVASQVYRKPTFKDTDYLELYNKSRKLFNNQQLAALKDLHRWRDTMARMEDESFGYILPNHMLLQIAEILPREAQGILACCNPIPPLVRQNLPELHKMILKAREITLAKAEKIIGPQPALTQHPKYDTDSLLNCCHDMTRQGELVADIEKDIAESGLITNTAAMYGKGGNSDVLISKSALISAFSPCKGNQMSVNKSNTTALVNEIQALFTNPFAKFLTTDTDNPIKPEAKDMWVLKSSTDKRKPDKEKNTDTDKVDLDSFTPEYAPPSKKRKVTVNLNTTSSVVNAGSDAGSKTKSIFGTAENEDNTSKGLTSQDIASRLQTLRDEVKKATKQIKEKEKKKKDKSDKTGDNIDVELSEPLTSTNNSNTSDGKKRKNQEPNENTSQDKKNKKKKKKKKEDQSDFKGFDYEAAEKQLKKEASEAKKPDIYNPKPPSWDNRKKGKKGKEDKSKGKKGKGSSGDV